ncbi:hypothetical protein [Halapricum salinum]|uniref:Uncharacterized protein n=1 Tax=Halapricum salinum TaxID=1457250 RepID=A0A4D6HB66_9EURY|nr:hypothetical protein [Halapricum salinum]QCC51179.1 hypothetical protein DV733_07960 [Halapricum salinum]
MRRVSVLSVLVVAVQPTLAHTTETAHHEPSPLPPVMFLAGVFVLGTAVYLDSRDALDRWLADLGVGVGVLAILAGIALLFVL